MHAPANEDSPFSPPYRGDTYVEHPLIALHDHRRLELSREVRTIQQDALVQLLDQVNVCPEPIPFIVSPECPPSDNVLIRSERVHAILQLLTHIRDSTYQSVLKQFYKKHGPTNHRAVAKDLYANCHFPPAFVQYQSLLTCLACDTCQKMTSQQLHNHTVDLLEKLAVTCIRAGWFVDAEKFANRALKHEPYSTRARLWLALLPQPGSYPTNFPKWIEQRVEIQRAMLRRLEDEQRGDYNVMAMAKERRDRVPETLRVTGTFGVELGPQGWRSIVRLRKGAVVIVAPPISCAPCYVEDDEACAELHAAEIKSKTVTTNTNINAKGMATPVTPLRSSSGVILRAGAPNSTDAEGAISASKSSVPLSPQSPQSLSSPAVAPHPPNPPPALKFTYSSSTPLLDLAIDDTFALALAADNIFTEAAEKAELHAMEQQREKKVESSLQEPKLQLDLTTMILRTPPNSFLPRPIKRFKLPNAPAPAPLPTSPRLRSPLAKYSFTFNERPAPASVPSTHTAEDPPLLTLALLTETLLNAAKTLPHVRAQIRAAAARCTRAAESVIDLVGEEVRAACMVVTCFYNVAIPYSDPETGEGDKGKTKEGEKNKIKMRSFGGRNEYGTAHAGHGLYLPMLNLLSTDSERANTEATFVGPYLFLRTTKDIEAGTLLSYAGFPGTIHPPRQHAAERKRKVGLTRRPTNTAGASSEGGLAADASVISAGAAADTSTGAPPSKERASIIAASVDHGTENPSSDLIIDSTSMSKPLLSGHRFAATPETSKGGSRGHSSEL